MYYTIKSLNVKKWTNQLLGGQTNFQSYLFAFSTFLSRFLKNLPEKYLELFMKIARLIII